MDWRKIEHMWRSLLVTACVIAANAQDLPRGQIIDSVKCLANAAQSYSLYLPSSYAPDRQWNIILLFDAGGRGRRGVERYQAAAEQYGYIVAGSNNSRNGPWEVSIKAARAMNADVRKRFTINPKRVYTAGMSGGARVAMKVALEEGGVAGVMASSAGFPGEPQAKLAFPVFGTAGTEDFNYIEMQQLDQLVTSPHRVAVFSGGHAWLPSDLGLQAVEWMELQAMKTGLRKRDDALAAKIFASREAQANSLKNEVEAWREFNNLAVDFDGLRDVLKVKARADALRRQKNVAEALTRQRAEEQAELRLDSEIADLEQGLGGEREAREASIDQLKSRLLALSSQAKAVDDTSDRRMARRVLSGVIASARGLGDDEYMKLLDRFRPPAAPQ
jgi:dienelactone hydrolase